MQLWLEPLGEQSEIVSLKHGSPQKPLWLRHLAGEVRLCPTAGINSRAS